MTGRLERVLVRPPLAEDAEHWRAYGWRAAPDHAAAAAEHERLCEMLEAAGAEVVVSRHDPGNPDAIYVYDPVLVGAEGAVLLRPGKEKRRGEPTAIAASLAAADVPVATRARRAGGRRGRRHGLARRAHASRRDRLPDEFCGRTCARRCLSRRRGDRLRSAALERKRRGDASHVVHLAARPRSRARVPADRAGPPPRAPRRARHRGRRGTRRGVRDAGPERPRARPASGARARRQSRRRAAAWSGQASTSSSIAARRSRRRATAARPASPARCFAARRGRSRLRSPEP